MENNTVAQPTQQPNSSIVPAAQQDHITPSKLAILRPDIVEGIQQFAKHIVQSQLTQLRNPADAFLVIAYGAEFGMGPITAMQTIYVVKGKPSMSGQAMLGVIRASGKGKISIGWNRDGDYAYAKGVRTDTGEEYEATFDMEDARRAGLTNNPTWKSYPKQMCQWRAVSELARFLFSDVIGGMYTPDEIDPGIGQDPNGGIIITGPSEPPKPPTNTSASTPPAAKREAPPAAPAETPQNSAPPAPVAVVWPNTDAVDKIYRRYVERYDANATPDDLGKLLGIDYYDHSENGWGRWQSLQEAGLTIKNIMEAGHPNPDAAIEQGATESVLSQDEVEVLRDFITGNFDITLEEALVKLERNERYWLGTVTAERNRAIGVLTQQYQVPMIVDAATFNGHHTVLHGVVDVRLFGRDHMRDLGQDWAAFVEAMQKDARVDLPASLRVTYKLNGSGNLQAESVSIKQQVMFDDVQF